MQGTEKDAGVALGMLPQIQNSEGTNQQSLGSIPGVTALAEKIFFLMPQNRHLDAPPSHATNVGTNDRTYANSLFVG